jgi:hypothetical protein
VVRVPSREIEGGLGQIQGALVEIEGGLRAASVQARDANSMVQGLATRCDPPHPLR